MEQIKIFCGDPTVVVAKTRTMAIALSVGTKYLHIGNVGPLLIESPWAQQLGSTGALKALDNPSVVQMIPKEQSSFWR